MHLVHADSDDLCSRLSWSVRTRWLIGFALLTVTLVIYSLVSLRYPLVPPVIVSLCYLAVNTFYLWWLKRGRDLNLLIYIPVIVDAVIITMLVHYTGSLDSPFAWIYTLVIVASGVPGGRRTSLLCASLSIFLYGTTVGLEMLGMLGHVHVGFATHHIPDGFQNSRLVFTNLVVFGILFYFTGIVNGYLSDVAAARQRRLVEAYRHQEEIRRQSLLQVVSAQEAERKRISRELHDEAGQALSVLAFNLDQIEKSCQEESQLVRGQLARLKALASQTAEEINRLVFDLRPAILDDFGLLPAVRWFASTYGEGLKVRVHVLGEERRLGTEIETVLFRVIQEGLTNTLKHADASRVDITFRFKPTSVTVTIEDDGNGFDLAEVLTEGHRRGFGLIGMQERVDLIGGHVDLHSEIGRGTMVTITIPLPQRRVDLSEMAHFDRR